MNATFLAGALSLCACSLTFAQDRLVSGKVTDKESGDPMPGVNVIIKGTMYGTATDKNGQYTIAVPNNATLEFSFIGFKGTEKQVGNATAINVVMVEDVINLGEGVVVTGLAIERERRSIGYGISEVSGKDLTVARETNIVNALQGKITGVVITQTGGGVGASSKIVIRGMNSLDGSNSPLWVLDGVPIYDEQNVTGSRINGNRDFFNGAAVINPDDVESISVLKGAAATALYGSRAAAGVILVTTKKGSARADGLSRPQISISSSTRFDWLFKAPDMQYQYAEGVSGGKYYGTAVYKAWGPEIRGQEVNNLSTLHQPGPLRAYRRNYNDFYEPGHTLINNVSIADASQKFNYHLSFTSLNQKGLLPNSPLNRITVSANAGGQHAKWISTQFSLQYVHTQIPNTGAGGLADPSIIAWNWFTPSTNFRWLKPYEDKLGAQITQGQSGQQGFSNPFWVRYRNKNEDVNNRAIFSLTQVFTPITGLNITSRLGYDFEKDRRLYTQSPGTWGRQQGSFTTSGTDRRQLNWDGIINYTRQVGKLWIKGLVGFNYNDRVMESETLSANSVSIRGIFNPIYVEQDSTSQNSTSSTRYYSHTKLMGVYTSLDLSYKNWLTISLTGRNDWTSTLPKGDNSYFYPSVSAAFVFTDALRIASRALSFGKLRASWAQVGRDTGPYALNLTYSPGVSVPGLFNNVYFPFRGQLGLIQGVSFPPKSLQSQRQNSWEVGAELAFLDGRISLDVAYFSSESSNQITNRPIPASTGFSSVTINQGRVISSGLETTLRGIVLNSKNFRWNTSINLSTLRTVIHDIGSRTINSTNAFGVSSVAVEGGTWELQGQGWKRDPASRRPLIDPKNGRRILGDVIRFGPTQPAITWGLTNEFYIIAGTVRLSFTIDGRIGGKLYSGTVATLQEAGFTVETAENRKGTYVDREGVIYDEQTGTVRDNDVPIRSTQDFWEQKNFQGKLGESGIFDATFIKLREIGLSFTLPRKWLSKTPFTAIIIGVEGRNLLLIYSKIPHIDPEVNLFGSGSGGSGVEYNAVPTTRSLGFNIGLKF